MKQVLIMSASLVLTLNVFAADDSGISAGTGLEASRSELAPRTNIQFYKEMASAINRNGSVNGKNVVVDDGKGVGTVYVEKGKNVVNITEVKKRAVIIQK